MQGRLGSVVSCRRRGNALVGCLVALGVVLVILGVGVVVVLMNWRSWTAEMLNAGTRTLINQSEIPEAEKAEMIAHVNEYTAAFEAGDVKLEDFQTVMEGLEQSPLIHIGILYSIEQGYVQTSTLPEEEKQAGGLALHRLARGIEAGSIPREAVQEVAAPIGYVDANGRFELNPREAVTDDMLREVISAADAKADEAGVAEEDYLVDLSDELKRILDASRAPAPTGGAVEAEPAAPASDGGEDGP